VVALAEGESCTRMLQNRHKFDTSALARSNGERPRDVGHRVTNFSRPNALPRQKDGSGD